jgi:predicted deacylase
MIKNATWNEAGIVIRVELEDGSVLWVPDDMNNRHRVELEEWVEAGNQIATYTPEAFV